MFNTLVRLRTIKMSLLKLLKGVLKKIKCKGLERYDIFIQSFILLYQKLGMNMMIKYPKFRYHIILKYFFLINKCFQNSDHIASNL